MDRDALAAAIRDAFIETSQFGPDLVDCITESVWSLVLAYGDERADEGITICPRCGGREFDDDMTFSGCRTCQMEQVKDEALAEARAKIEAIPTEHVAYYDEVLAALGGDEPLRPNEVRKDA